MTVPVKSGGSVGSKQEACSAGEAAALVLREQAARAGIDRYGAEQILEHTIEPVGCQNSAQA
jgi:hypothetical protein